MVLHRVQKWDFFNESYDPICMYDTAKSWSDTMSPCSSTTEILQLLPNLLKSPFICFIS